jgi:hypothetical protein
MADSEWRIASVVRQKWLATPFVLSLSKHEPKPSEP